MQKYKVSQVFVVGGMPKHTYVPREERRLEEQLRSAYDNLCKLVTVTGPTKSGKTVLAKKIFPSEMSVWVEGGTVKEENDLWSSILGEINGYTGLSRENGTSSTTHVDGSVEGGIDIIIAKGKGKVETGYEKAREEGKSKSLSINPCPAAIAQLRKKKHPLIIDDFHYLGRPMQKSIIRALKPLIFEGLPIILIAVPHRRYDAVKSEPELTGRLESILIPQWEESELLKIPSEGFHLLNIKVSDEACSRLAREAYGSPHLMQDFCKALCNMYGVKETLPQELVIKDINDDLFRSVAEVTGKTIFDKLARGPRQRADRIQRTLRTGQKADIYKVILFALAEIQPGLHTVEYEKLRAVIREILIENIPRAPEISRVLEKMSEIAAREEGSSNPVLEWDKKEQKLHIIDPFFTFYLKWGAPHLKM